MLTRYDEFVCHQTVSTFDHVATSAREWTERLWFSAHDTGGKCHLVAGFGYYPNRNIMDAFATVVIDGKTQHAVRASRELRPAVDEIKVGPLSYDVIEPLKKIRCRLDENEHGLSFDIEFEGSMPPHEEQPQFARSRGRVMENVMRYLQVGRPRGWIEVEGRKIEVGGDKWRAERDHSWGIRRGGGVPETGVQPGEIPVGYLFGLGVMQFDGWGASYHMRETWDGKPLHFSGGLFYPYGSDKQPLDLTGIEHNFEFRDDMRQMKAGKVTLNVEDGSRLEVSMEPVSICHLKAGGYFGYKDFIHGLWMGQSFLDGVRIDLTDPDQVREVSFLDDFMCRFKCGDDVGYGIVELVVIGKYPKYGYEGY